MIRFLKNHFIFVVFAIAFCSTFLFFHPYFIQGKVPFPGNLLVSTYTPWKWNPFPEYPNGPPNKPIGFDNVRQFYPNRQFTKEELTQFRLPLWNPYIFSGTPYIGAFDTAVFYPPGILFQIFPLIDAWSVFVIIQPMLSVIFMYLFLRSLDIDRIAGVFGSFVYAFSGWMIVYWEESLILEHSFLWLPLALYASNRIWDKKYISGLSLLVCALVSSICAGFFQMTIYVYIAVVAWNIYRFFKTQHEQKSKAVIACLGIVLSVFIAGIQLVPTLEAYVQSPRGTMDGIFLFREYLAPLQHIITLIVPDFWGNPGTYNYFGGDAFYFEKVIFFGIPALVCALYALIYSKQRHATFWKIFGSITCILGFALPTGWLPYILHIPVLASSYPTRIFALSLFAGSVLCAYGVAMYMNHRDTARMKRILLGVAVCLGMLWGIVGFAWALVHRYHDIVSLCALPIINILCKDINILHARSDIHLYASVSFRNMIVPTCFFIGTWIALWSVKKIRMYAYIPLFLVACASSFYFSYKYTYFSERRFVYPEHTMITKLKEKAGLYRVWGYGNAFIEKNLPQYFHLYSTDGYGYLSPKRYGEFLNTIRYEGSMSSIIRRSDTDLFEASEKEALGKGNPYRLRLMSLLGVKYIVETKKGLDKEHKAPEDRFPDTLFTLVYEDDTWNIWEYRDALPRAFFVSTVEHVADPQTLIHRIYDPSFDLRKTMFLSDPVEKEVTKSCVSSQEDATTIERYEPSRVVLSVHAPCDGAVFLSDTYYPGWHVYVDGKEEKLWEANYTFRAVFVSQGDHHIEFVYKPLSFMIGGGITLVGFGILGIVVYRLKKRTI